VHQVQVLWKVRGDLSRAPPNDVGLADLVACSRPTFIKAR